MSQAPEFSGTGCSASARAQSQHPNVLSTTVGTNYELTEWDRDTKQLLLVKLQIELV
jgi:hypothetical protein